MRATFSIFLLLAGLAGCGDPLAGVDRIADVELADDAAKAPQAVPSQEEYAKGGFLGALLGGGAPAQGGAAGDPKASAEDVPVGTVLPYGEVGRACAAKGSQLGRRIERSSSGRYALHDTAPDSTKPRTFYITGFTDRCPRQFTAALATLGAPSLHEELRYGRPSDAFPYSSTDEAYEQAKRLTCGSSRRKPCGPGIRRMDRTTVFVSTYEHFGGNARWSEILVHDGKLLASAIKSAR